MGVVEVMPAIRHRHVESEEVPQSLVVSSANGIDRHVVTAKAHALLHPSDGEVRAPEAQKQDMDMVPLRLEVREKPRQPPSRQSRLEREIRALGRKLPHAFEHDAARRDRYRLWTEPRQPACDRISVDELSYLEGIAQEIGRRSGPVSYTHLRAHETRHDLVCRLLL